MFNKLKIYLSLYHPLVHTLIIGQAFIILGISMSVPFLAVYLSKTTGLNSASIGLMIGSGALAGTIGGFVGGALSDYIGRKQVLVGSLILSTFVFVGYASTTSTAIIFMLIIISGLASSFFATVSKALIADLTTAEQRLKVFSLLNLTLNIGWGIGPLLGVYFGLAATSLPFLITAIIYFLYACSVLFLFKIFHSASQNGPTSRGVSMGKAIRAIAQDKALSLYVAGGLLLAIAAGQFAILLSQFLLHRFGEDGTNMLGLILGVNALVIIIFQLPFSRWAENKSPLLILFFGVLCFSVGLFGFGVSYHIVSLIVFMIVFSIGEIFIAPITSILIDKIAPEDLKGTYFGAQNFASIGIFIGPPLGGYLLMEFGGMAMYSVLSIIALTCTIFYIFGYISVKSRAQVIAETVKV